MGGVDLAQSGLTLGFSGSIATPAFGSTPDGPALNGNNLFLAHCGSSSPFAMQTASAAMTIFWRGFQVSTPAINGGYIGVQYSDPNGSPFVIMILQVDGSGPTNLLVLWNAGGSLLNYNPSAGLPSNGAMHSLAATGQSGGNINLYIDNVKQGAGTSWGSAPTASATTSAIIGNGLANNSYCNIGCFWNRILSDAELTQMHLDPYSFIVPAEYDPPAMFISAPPSVFVLMPQIVT